MKQNYFSDQIKNNYIKQIIEKYLVSYNDIDYAYAVMSKKNSNHMIVISNLSDWFKLYLDNGYQDIDPVIINALTRMSSFRWDENLKIGEKWTLPRIFESGKKYNVFYGYSFVLHDPYDNLVVFSLMLDKLLIPETEELIENNKEKLQSFLIQTHEMLLHIYKDTQSDKNDLFEELSSREMEVLYWSSLGKTYPEVASILNITVSTVKFHMGRVVKKLGVKNAKHAIRLSAELNIISPSQRERR